MANIINLTVMGQPAAPYNSSGPTGSPYGRFANGAISEQQSFVVANIIKVSSYTQPTSGSTYPAVNSVVQYKSVNNTNGAITKVKMYVNEARGAIVTASNA